MSDFKFISTPENSELLKAYSQKYLSLYEVTLVEANNISSSLDETTAAYYEKLNLALSYHAISQMMNQALRQQFISAMNYTLLVKSVAQSNDSDCQSFMSRAFEKSAKEGDLRLFAQFPTAKYSPLTRKLLIERHSLFHSVKNGNQSESCASSSEPAENVARPM